MQERRSPQIASLGRSPSAAIACGTILLSLAGCSEHVRVRSYWATTIVRMPVGSTYAWFSEANETTPSLADPELHGFIQQEIEEALAELGYVRPADGGQTHFLVSYRSSMGVESTNWGPANQAVLAIQAHHPDGRVIWRGWAEGKVDSSTPPEARRERLVRVVRKILSEFHAG